MTDRIHFFAALTGAVLLCGGVCSRYGSSASLIVGGVLLIAAVIAARLWGN